MLAGRLVLISLALAAAGCVSAPLATLPPEHRAGEAPALNAMSTRTVGEAIYEIFNIEERVGAILQEPFHLKVFAARAFLPSGMILPPADDGGTVVYCSDEPVVSYGGGMKSQICLRDQVKDNRFDEWKAPDGPPARVAWQRIKKPVSFKFGDAQADAGGWRYELLYQGVAGNVVSLTYREFDGDMIRAAFQQDLTYTLASGGPTDVSFRTTRIRIYSADNNSIRYEVLAGLKGR